MAKTNWFDKISLVVMFAALMIGLIWVFKEPSLPEFLKGCAQLVLGAWLRDIVGPPPNNQQNNFSGPSTAIPIVEESKSNETKNN